MLDISLKYFRFVNYFIVTVLIVTSLLLIRSIISTTFSKSNSDLSSQADTTFKDGPLNKHGIMDYSSILEKNPFGRPLKLLPISLSQKKEVRQGPVSDLDLIGTAVGLENPGYAIFVDNSASSDGKQEIFAFGENVFNYGKLIKIESSSVELARDSDVFTVEISYDENKGDNRDHRVKKTTTNKRSSKKSFAKKISEGKYILDSRKVQQSLENPERLLTDARLLPVIKNGKQKGFIISEIVPEGIYHSIGLKNGDTLLKINGLEISNPEVAIQAMSALKGMNSIDLDIIRSGAKMSLSYQIR